jgi:hypothetical protein
MIKLPVQLAIAKASQTISEPKDTVSSTKKNCGDCFPMGAEKQKIADDAFSSANECVKQMLNN